MFAALDAQFHAACVISKQKVVLELREGMLQSRKDKVPRDITLRKYERWAI